MSQVFYFLVYKTMKQGFLKIVFLSVVLVHSHQGLAEEFLSPIEFEVQALKHNLDLRLEETQLKQIKAESVGIRVPSLQVGVSQMEMKGGSTAQGWQVSQSIPFPTKINADYKARQFALDAGKSSLEAKTQEIKAMARFIYFFIWESQEQERILQEKIDLLKKHLTIARSIAR